MQTSSPLHHPVKTRNMRKILFAASLFLLSCNQRNADSGKKEEGFTTTPSGFQYKIIRSQSGGDSLRSGDVVKVYIRQFIDDSLLNDNRTTVPEFVKMDSTLRTFDYTEILPLMRVGDSAVCLFSTKEIMKRAAAETYPPLFLERGKYIRVYLKLAARYDSDSLAMAEYGRESERYEQLRVAGEKSGYERAAASFDSLMKTAGHPLIRLSNGVCIYKVESGKGPAIRKMDSVHVVYRGRMDNGKEFESTTLNKPFALHAANYEAVEGFDAGIAALAFGDSAVLYLPSKLAYGAGGAGNKVPPFANLIFEVRVLRP